jgi:hypothetical protein
VKRARHRREEGHGLVDELFGESQAERQPAPLERREADEGIDELVKILSDSWRRPLSILIPSGWAMTETRPLARSTTTPK